MVSSVVKAGATEVSRRVVNRVVNAKKKKEKDGKSKRRRVRLLTLGQREELMWIARHLGRSAAAERMVHYRR